MHDNFIGLFILISICYSNFYLQFLFKLYFADVREAIEVLKNYLGDDKRGMSFSCIIIYDNRKNDNNNNCKIYNNNNGNMIKKDFYCLFFASSREHNDQEQNNDNYLDLTVPRSNNKKWLRMHGRTSNR